MTGASGPQWSDPFPTIVREQYRAMAIAAIDALSLTEESETIPVFVDDDPPTMLWRGFDQVPARHAEFIPHRRLTNPWHSDECPDCAAEPGVHDRRQAEHQAASLERDQ